MKTLWISVSIVAALGMLSPGAKAFTTDKNAVYVEPTIAKPGYLVPTTDTTFGTTFTRFAPDPGTVINLPGGGGPLTAGRDFRQHGPKDIPWSSTSKWIAWQNPSTGGGSPTKVYSLVTDGFRKSCPNQPGGDDRWHPSTTRPDVRVIANDAKLYWFNISTCAITKTINLPFTVNGIGAGEGNITNDGSKVVLHDATRMFAVNMDTGLVGPVKDISNCGLPTGCTVGWASASPGGARAVVHYSPDRDQVYNLNGTTLALTRRVQPSGSLQCDGQSPAEGNVYNTGHPDMYKATDGSGDHLVGQRRSWCQDDVTVDSFGNPIGQVVDVTINTGVVRSLMTPTNSASSHHISARSYPGRPGWVIVSFYPADGKRFSDEVIALKTDGSGAVERYVHHHSEWTTPSPACYRAEVHPVPNRNGTQIMFNSNMVHDATGGIAGCPENGGIVQGYILNR